MSANFNSGGFLAFKIILVLYVLALIYYAFQNLGSGANFSTGIMTYLIYIIEPLLIAATMALQFLAMHKKDLKKAQISLILFILYTGFVLYAAIMGILHIASVKFTALLQVCISLAIMCGITFGSFQVYKALKPAGSSNGDLIKGIMTP